MIGSDVAHFPERGAEPEVDFILTVGAQRIPVEVKYRRRIDHRDTLGLRSFIDKPHYNAPFGLLVTMTDDHGTEGPKDRLAAALDAAPLAMRPHPGVRGSAVKDLLLPSLWYHCMDDI